MGVEEPPALVSAVSDDAEGRNPIATPTSQFSCAVNEFPVLAVALIAVDSVKWPGTVRAVELIDVMVFTTCCIDAALGMTGTFNCSVLGGTSE